MKINPIEIDLLAMQLGHMKSNHGIRPSGDRPLEFGHGKDRPWELGL